MLTILIVTHNSANVIIDALEPIYGCEQIEQFVVVDNASEDETVAIIRERFHGVKVIQNHDNRGFGRACNQVLESISTKYVLLLNPDAVIQETAITGLVTALETHPNAAIAAPLLEGHDFDPSTYSIRVPIFHDESIQTPEVTWQNNMAQVEFISGAVAMWRMEHMRKVGFFDPAFFLFYEDDDISLRVAKAGYNMLLLAGLDVTHIPGTSCPMTDQLKSIKRRSSLWSRYYIGRKYDGKFSAYIGALRVAIRAWRRLRAKRKEPDNTDEKMNLTHQLWAAKYFITNPTYFDVNDVQ